MASVLKPVDDTRMFEKFGRTLADAGYRVAVAGRGTAQASQASGITQRVLFQGQRLGLDRLAAQGRYWRLLRQAQPALVVVHAPELLPLTLLWHRLTGRPFLYDVRENYALNIRTQQVYRGGLKRLLARAVGWVESHAAHRAAAVLLAERSYAQELPWLPRHCTVVLENKYAPPAAPASAAAAVTLPTTEQPLRLLFTGTSSALTGVFDAIDFARQLRGAWPQLTLTIIGYCQQPPELARLRQLAQAHADWLRVVGGAQPVPHAAIVAEIGHHHLGLLPYREHPSSWRCLPTKLYEYLASGLPVLIPPNPLWTAEVQRYQAGLTVAFDRPLPDAQALARQLSGQRFYPSGPPAEALWSSEAPRLLGVVRQALGLRSETAPFPATF
ncbi:glycosyltransferase family 4 protein [Hymenobacter sp. CRA2]|uniref:glycosyltransferase family 4 protein n=1 Tax=Hymenobacter sp. CRA2 TaxID=1955620 RepID=UPI00098F05E8|nr:glycosyltransferase family 4 protein [Hymenobacter sp. CRA2]